MTNQKNTHKMLPDDNITSNMMMEYGYCWSGMYPLTAQTAEDIWKKNICPVYLLYEDGTESVIEEDCSFSKKYLYGIEKADWISYMLKEVKKYSNAKGTCLRCSWNGFPKRTRIKTLLRWFEDSFGAYTLKMVMTGSAWKAPDLTPELICADDEDFHICLEGRWLVIKLKTTQELIARLQFILGRKTDRKEKWAFNYYYSPGRESRISAVNLAENSKDDINLVKDILDMEEEAVYLFKKSNDLQRIYNTYCYSGKKPNGSM